MMTKSIITQLEKTEYSGDSDDLQWIKATTLDGNEMVFWGSKESCVNLLALEQQQTPILVSCSRCDTNNECIHLMGDFFSIPESATVTIYPYKPEKINQLLGRGYKKNDVVKQLTRLLTRSYSTLKLSDVLGAK